MQHWWILVLGSAWLLQACATPVAPTGGDRDTTPPVLQTEGTTANEQTNFKPTQILLSYDEWLQLKDLTKEVIVSPPLAYRPTIDLRKKTVRFTFDEREVLRDSATYTINFGDAVQDLNEGNSAAARFVFATGPFIDSLVVTASVVDALTEKPVENALVLLYEDLRDSVVYDALPFYFAKTDKQGQATIRNVRKGVYRAAALTDGNQNYRLDGSKEQIGFLAELVPVSDSGKTALNLRLFLEDPPQRIVQKNTKAYGLVNLTFANPPRNEAITVSETPGLRTFEEAVKDSIYLWYTYEGSDDWYAYYERPDRVDTIRVPPRAKATTAFGRRLTVRELARKTVPLIGETAATFDFSHPLLAVSADSIQIFRDSLPEPSAPTQVVVDTNALRRAAVYFARRGGSTYRVRLLPGAVTDIFGYANSDTLEQTYRAIPADELSALQLAVTGMDATRQYVFRFGFAKKEPIETFVVNGQSSATLDLPPLRAETYELEVIEDINRDGRWSTGNYLEGRQPERTFTQSIGPLRESWEQVEAIEVSFERRAAPAAVPPSMPAPTGPKRRRN